MSLRAAVSAPEWQARVDLAAAYRLVVPHGVAVAAQAGGLLPISQQAALVLGRLAYHDYEGPALRDAERARLVDAIVDGMPQQSREVTHGQGAKLLWPALLRRLDRRLPGYDA